MILLRPSIDLTGGAALLAAAFLQTVDPVVPNASGGNIVATILTALGASGIVTYIAKRALEHYITTQNAERQEEKAERDRQHADNNARFEALTKQIASLSERDGQRVNEMIATYRDEIDFWRQLYISERDRCNMPSPPT